MMTHRHVHDVLGIIHPDYWYISLIFGAFLQTSPLKGNLLRLADSIHESENHTNRQQTLLVTREKDDKYCATDNTALWTSSSFSPLDYPCKLVKSLYFQPQQGAPIKLTKSKSMAASYMTPTIMETLMAASLNTTYSDEDFKTLLLEQHGIRSNHIYKEWTGVSFA
jgi:hypothetical protein